jgi:hypothetical protein
MLIALALSCLSLAVTPSSATAVSVACVTPAPAPTAAPTATPTIAPTAAPTSGAAVFPNGHYPPVGTQLYAKTSVWNQVIPPNPKPLANSAAIVAAQFPGTVANASGNEIRGQEGGQYDYSHVAVYAASTDVLIHTACNQYCPTTPVGDILIPAKARPAGGSDAHLVDIQPDGTEIDMWACYGGIPTGTGVWQTGATITCGNVSNAGNLFTGPGQDAVGPGADAMNSALLAGLITPAEIISGQINHALFITGQCAVGMQFPAPPGSGTDKCTSGVGPPLGGREQYTVPCATTQQSTVLAPWEKAILCALNVYGGYMGDDGGGGVNFTGIGVGLGGENAEEGYQWGLISSTGVGDDLTPMIASSGWTSINIPSTLTMLRVFSNHIDSTGAWDPPGVNFKANIIWLDPCVTQKTC